MKTRSFSAGTVRALLVLAAAVLVACAPPLDNRAQGNLRIVLPGGAGARAIDPPEGITSYQLEFSGPGDASIIRTLEPGTPELILNLALGDWTIQAKAYQGEVLRGSGEAFVTVEAGKTAEAKIIMSVIYPPSAARDITAFSFAAPPAAGIIDPAAKTVAVTVLPGTALTGLIPAIALSPGASVSPASGAERDFTGPVEYVVTAADGSAGTWTVTVTAPDSLNTIALIQAYLASATGGDSASDPVPLPVTLNLADPDGNGWAELLGAIAGADKRVALDLSASGITGMTATAGEFDPGYTISAGKNRIVSLVLPVEAASIKGTTEYSERAFQHFSGLSSVTLPASLISMGANPFAGCVNLTVITVDSGNAGYSAQGGMLLDNIGDTLIAYPSAAGAIALSGITTVGSYAFSGCAALTSVELPNVGYIDSYAFSHTGAGPLTVTLGSPNPVWLGLDIFSNVSEAKTVIVKVPSGATAYDSSPVNTTGNIWGNGFRGGGWSSGTVTNSSYVNSNITVIIMPGHLASVSDVAAYLAVTLGSAAFPVSLPVALNLTSDWMDLLGAIDTANKRVALDLSACGISGMTATAGEFDPGYTISAGKNRIVSLVLPDAATSILDSDASNSQSFTSLASLTGVNIGDTGLYTFSGCDALVSVNLPAVTIVDRYAFSGCVGLSTVNLPVVQNIEAYAFSGCAALTLTGLPATLTNLGSGAFQGCTGLTLTSLPSGLLYTGDRAFDGCTGLVSIYLPASLTSIDFNPFTGCANLTNIIVETGNPNYRADNGMLFDTTVSETLISYPSAAGDITLPGILVVGDSVFEGNTALTSVTLPSAIDIGYSAFEGCTGLITVDFPVATTVMDGAFSGCTALTTVRLGAFVPNLGTSIFDGINSAQTVTVSAPLMAILDYGSAYYSDTDYSDNWGNAFRGRGWDGTNYLSGTVNTNISLLFEGY